MSFRAITAFLICCLISFTSVADELALNPSHPEKYTVVKGDTLWDISGMFLKDPWKWPKIWHNNPQIKNPHWIYPGDIVTLSYHNGKPRLSVHRGGMAGANDQLSPRIRSEDLKEQIPVIPIDAIKQFLTSPRVVTRSDIQNAPYIVDIAGEHLVGGAGEHIYVRSILDDSVGGYTVFRPGMSYIDPVTGDHLGNEALYVADTNLLRVGDPATLLLTRTERETLVGDRLLPIVQEKIQLSYQPRAPKFDISGHIISVLGGVSQIGQYNVVVIDRGTADGVDTGHVLAILQSGAIVRDTVLNSTAQNIKMPDEHAGILLVFRPFERVSYALVMRATGALHIMDLVRTP